MRLEVGQEGAAAHVGAPPPQQMKRGAWRDGKEMACGWGEGGSQGGSRRGAAAARALGLAPSSGGRRRAAAFTAAASSPSVAAGISILVYKTYRTIQTDS